MYVKFCRKHWFIDYTNLQDSNTNKSNERKTDQLWGLFFCAILSTLIDTEETWGTYNWLKSTCIYKRISLKYGCFGHRDHNQYWFTCVHLSIIRLVAKAIWPLKCLLGRDYEQLNVMCTNALKLHFRFHLILLVFWPSVSPPQLLHCVLLISSVYHPSLHVL